LRWLARRVVAVVVTLVVTSVLAFSLLDLLPGGPETALLGGKPATPAARSAIRSEFHLDKPFLTQYWIWVRGAVHGDFNRSVVGQEPVSAIILQRLPVTAELAVYGLVLALLVGVPLGLLAGMRRAGAVDRSVTVLTLLGFSIPPFAVGTLLLYVFAVDLGWFPVLGAGSGTVPRLVHLTLPAIALAFASAAFVIRQTRASTVDVAAQDYITFARARGLSPWRIWSRYVLRSASLPILTTAGLLLGASLGGLVLIEQTFTIPGLGSLLVGAVQNKDVPVVQALAVLSAALVAVTLLVVDALSFLLDPRLRRER
jgi:peptide/nickel transport system permease protein